MYKLINIKSLKHLATVQNATDHSASYPVYLKNNVTIISSLDNFLRTKFIFKITLL